MQLAGGERGAPSRWPAQAPIELGRPWSGSLEARPLVAARLPPPLGAARTSSREQWASLHSAAALQFGRR